MGARAFGRREATLLGVFALGLVAAAGCSDDDGDETGTGATGASSSSSSSGSGAATSSSSSSSAGPGGGGSGAEGGSGGVGGAAGAGGAGGAGGASGGGGEGGKAAFMVTTFGVPLSPAGPDQLQSVTAAPGDSFLAAGFAAPAVGGTRTVTVVKFGPTGPDLAFGTGSIAVTPLVFVGGNDEIDITTQSDGKILVSASVANAVNPSDRDVAVVRLLANGTLDAGFGSAGVTVVDLNTAFDNAGMLVGLDAARSITVDGDDNIFVHAASRGLGDASGGGPRMDTDYTVFKLSPGGVFDDTFGDAGQFRLDIAETNATPRGIKAMPDGSLIVSGYASTPDSANTTQPVLYKLTEAGDLDATFAVFHEQVLLLQTEVYNFAVHGNNLVTAGYGRNTGDTNDYVSLRFDATTGARDTTWGGAANGAVVIDPSGSMLGSNARNALGLPNGGTILIGSTGPGNMPAQDAVFVVLDANGALDTNYDTGVHVLKLGKDGNDQFWGGAVSGNHVALVGYQGGGMAQTDIMNDDAHGAIFEIQP